MYKVKYPQIYKCIQSQSKQIENSERQKFILQAEQLIKLFFIKNILIIYHKMLYGSMILPQKIQEKLRLKYST